MRKLSTGRLAIIIFAILVIVFCVLCGYAVLRDRSMHTNLTDNTFFDVSVLQARGSKTTSLDASGLTPDQAKEKIREIVDSNKQQIEITLTNPSNADQTWVYDLTPSISYDVDTQVDTAYNEQLTSTFLDRFGYNVMGNVLPERHYAVTYTIALDDEGVKNFLKDSCNGSSTPATNAEYTFDNGAAAVVPSKPGSIMDMDKSYQDIENLVQRMRDGESLETTSLPISFQPVAAEITESNIGYAIVISKSKLELTLYKNGEVVKSYPVGMGSQRFPTPTGVFEIISKRTDPPWYNPMPEVNHMPKYMPPGPDCPLGKRAMGISSPQIFIHGVPESVRSKIGAFMSAGCINMYNEDVIELYDLVDIGCPVYIYQ